MTAPDEERSEPRKGGYVVGAYAASPTAAEWDPEVEAAYVDALASDPRIGALELPWNGSLHARDEEWLLTRLPLRLDAVLTDVANVFLTIARGDPHYGLAAEDAAGRDRALADAARLRDDVHRFNDRRGRPAVRAVELHPGPRAAQGSAAALARSLRELASWDWDGAELVIEHSDAQVPEHEPEKGFLPLIDEIAAIREARVAIGLVLNWGRSAIEFHDAARPIDHVREARRAGLLRGFIVSGASDQHGAFDRPWVDAHHAFRRSELHPYGDPISLLTEERLAPVVDALGRDVWLGVKLAWPSGTTGTTAERVGMIQDALDALDRVTGR